MSRLPRTETGFVLPTAIFLLVVLAALATYMVSLSRTSHLSSALDVQGTRAYLAARAGPYPDGADTVDVYVITSTAKSGVPGQVDYVERQIRASFSK